MDVRPRGVRWSLHAGRRALRQHGSAIGIVASFGCNRPTVTLVAAAAGLGSCTLSPRPELGRAPCRRDERQMIFCSWVMVGVH